MTRKPTVLPRIHPSNLPQPGKLLAAHVEKNAFGPSSLQNLGLGNPLINFLGSCDAQCLLQLLELGSLEVSFNFRRNTPTFAPVESGLHTDCPIDRQFRFARKLPVAKHRHTEPAEVLVRFQGTVFHTNKVVEIRIGESTKVLEVVSFFRLLPRVTLLQHMGNSGPRFFVDNKGRQVGIVVSGRV
jgi:hypothetical protein